MRVKTCPKCATAMNDDNWNGISRLCSDCCTRWNEFRAVEMKEILKEYQNFHKRYVDFEKEVYMKFMTEGSL